MAKLKTLEINCDRLTKGNMYKNGSYCSAGHYLHKIKGLTHQELETDDYSYDDSTEETTLERIIDVNDDDIPWKEKEKKINKLFKEIGIRCTFKNKWW